MPVKVAKEFRWEMGHRLPYHPLCQNVHGHSYAMTIEVEGEPNAQGMVIDFAEIAAIVRPLIDTMDHAFMLDPDDQVMREFLCENGLKTLAVPFYSTAENIANWIADQTAPALFAMSKAARVTVRIYETPSSFAETTRTSG